MSEKITKEGVEKLELALESDARFDKDPNVRRRLIDHLGTIKLTFHRGADQTADGIEHIKDHMEAINKLVNEVLAENAAEKKVKKPATLSQKTILALERSEIVENLVSQYAEQVNILRDHFNVLSVLDDGSLGIEGIDGKEYRVPSFSSIMQGLKPYHFEKFKQGFTQMLLVPFGMSLDKLLRAAANYSPSTFPQLLDGRKVPHDLDILSGIVYEMKKFHLTNHGGKTKFEMLNNKGGWQVHLVEPFQQPDLSNTTKTSGRETFNPGVTAHAFLNSVGVGDYVHEEGLTIETALTHHMKTVFDAKPMQTNQYFLLFGAYVPDRHAVPSLSCYFNGKNKKEFDNYTGIEVMHPPDEILDYSQFRTSVRIPIKCKPILKILSNS